MHSFREFLLENTMTVPDAMKLLGASSDDLSNPDKIKSLYRAQSLKHHPDVGGTTDMMQRINAAYQMLSKGKTKASPYAFDREAYNKKHELLADVILADIEKRLDPAKFSAYFEKILGQPFHSNVEKKIGGYGSKTVRVHMTFSNVDKSTIIDVEYTTDTNRVDMEKPMIGLSGLMLKTGVFVEVMHNRRKEKMKRRDWDFTGNAEIFNDPKVLFPEAKLRKMANAPTRAKVSRRDFEIAFTKELGANFIGNDIYIRLGGGYRLALYRMTIMRVAAYMINGLYLNMKRVGRVNVVSFYEDGETLDFLLDNLKKIKNSDDETKILSVLNKMSDEYKERRNNK